jgi:exonuclease III
LDIIFFQEVENENIELDDFNIVYNINEDKRGTAIALRQHIQFSNIEKSLDSRMLVLRINNNITLCNIYAPSGSQHRQYRDIFFNSNLAYYLRNLTDYLIMGGDFNSVIHAKDSIGNSNFCNALQRTVQTYNF